MKQTHVVVCKSYFTTLIFISFRLLKFLFYFVNINQLHLERLYALRLATPLQKICIMMYMLISINVYIMIALVDLKG